VSYICDFTQEIGFNLPGAEAFGMEVLLNAAPALSGAGVVEARFVRAAGGGWTVILGDL